jgi:hypothetical protein
MQALLYYLAKNNYNRQKAWHRRQLFEKNKKIRLFS